MVLKGKPSIVEVEWVDAASSGEEMAFDEAIKRVTLVRRFTCGYLINKTREAILVAETYDPEQTGNEKGEGGCDVTIIPRSWAKSIITLVPAAEQPEKETE